MLYSDTDSVYFYAPEDWSNKKINEQLDKIGKKHCDDTELGKCKFETSDDIGDCLEEYNKHVKDGDEPLKYPFFD